ncbi:MAG: glucose-1-phosphate thymidylyltransferase [Nitrospirota bacterium]
MKGLILSGGKGTRLRPITFTSAKQLIPIANKPVLFYGIESLCEAGITDIGIVVGDTAEEVKMAVKDGSYWGVKISYIHQEEPLGLAHALLVSEGFLKDEPFVMYLGDNLILGGIKELVKEFNVRKPNAEILLSKVSNPSQFGVAELKDGKVIRLIEKPKEPKSDLALVGVYMFDHNVFKAAKNIKPSWRSELEITDAIQYLIDNGYEVYPHMISGWWKDTGKVEDILEANRMVLDTFEMRIEGTVDTGSKVDFKVVIEKGAEVIASTIRGPAIIGESTQIINSYIGPFTSIADNVLIKDSEIEHSIVMNGSSIIDIRSRIEDSLIGRNVEISRSSHRQKTYRLILGDNSKIGVL